MKKHLLLVAMIMVLVLSFSWGISAADDPNQYDVAADISAGYSSADLWIGTLAAWEAAGGDVQGTGTFFDNGEAIADNDIIITNGVCGIVLAVETRNPWGYPAGSVLDAGTVEYTSGALTTATGNRDMTWSIEPLVNDWDSWAPDNCGEVSFSLVNYDFANETEDAGGLTAVKVSRIYDIGGISFNVISYYSIAPDVSYAYMYTELENTTGAATGDVADDEDDLGTSFSVTNKGDDGGAMYGIGQSVGSYAMTGGKEYFCGLYYDGSYFDMLDGSVGYKQIYCSDDFAADETRVYDCYIVLSDTADFNALNTLKMELDGITDYTTVSGTTEPDGTVIVKKDDTLIGWYKADALGDFSFKVPQADESTYTMYLEANGYADGETDTINNDGATYDAGNLASGAAKAEMTMTVKDTEGNPIYAKIEVFESHDGGNTYDSAYPMVRFNGDSIYYTESDGTGESTGVINFEVEAGYYKVVVYGEGYWFYSEPMAMTGNTADSTTLYPEIEMVYSVPEGWLSADLHHHGNKNDAFSSPEDVIKSLAAAGLDVGCMTDHDFTTNNEEMAALSESYGLTGYIPSEEISCSWSHFNVLPLTEAGYDNFLDVDQENNIMDQFAQLPVFVQQAEDTGAAITANHPWCSYGLFYAYAYGSIPGGYTDDYDNIEINVARSDEENVDTMITATQLWTSYQDGTALYQDINGDDVVTEKAHYLVGGSDTHDVRYPGFSNVTDYSNTRGNESAEDVGDNSYCSGKARTFAYVGTDVTENTSEDYIMDNALAYDEAVVTGNSYVSTSPVLDMDRLPGETYNVYANTEFNAYVEVQDIYGSCQFYVLTKTGTTDINTSTIGQSKRMKDYLTYDAEATSASSSYHNPDTGIYEYEVCVPVEEEDTWAALLVIDGSGNYAITNPWWIDVNSFSDVPETTWYTEALIMGYNYGIIHGYSDGTFGPQKQVTRAEFAQMFYGLLRLIDQYEVVEMDIVNPDASFSDVKSGSWYYNAVMYLAQREYVNGYTDGTFKPNAYISRAEISQIMYNVVMDIMKDNLYPYRHAYFADVAQGEWYYEAIMTLADAGFVNGYPVMPVSTGYYEEPADYYYLPQNTATRAESIQFIFSMMHGGQPD